jgi:hypothetical protein
MAMYLLVAYQTAQSPQLLAATQELSRADSRAEFVLLVPATPAGSLLIKEEGDPAGIARRRAASARIWLDDAGVQMADAKVGQADPLQAISDEMESGQSYAGIVISTLPQGVSQWLRLDLVSQVRRRFPSIPVDHVISEVPAASK